jgi:hypothetical protein
MNIDWNASTALATFALAGATVWLGWTTRAMVKDNKEVLIKEKLESLCDSLMKFKDAIKVFPNLFNEEQESCGYTRHIEFDEAINKIQLLRNDITIFSSYFQCASMKECADQLMKKIVNFDSVIADKRKNFWKNGRIYLKDFQALIDEMLGLAEKAAEVCFDTLALQKTKIC